MNFGCTSPDRGPGLYAVCGRILDPRKIVSWSEILPCHTFRLALAHRWFFLASGIATKCSQSEANRSIRLSAFAALLATSALSCQYWYVLRGLRMGAYLSKYRSTFEAQRRYETTTTTTTIAASPAIANARVAQMII
jgi:hypothetical protein